MNRLSALCSGTLTINKVCVTPEIRKEAEELIEICSVVADSHRYSIGTTTLFFVSVYATICFYPEFVRNFKAKVLHHFSQDFYDHIVQLSNSDYKDDLVEMLAKELKMNKARSHGKVLLLDIVKWIIRQYPESEERFVYLLTHSEKSVLRETD